MTTHHPPASMKRARKRAHACTCVRARAPLFRRPGAMGRRLPRAAPCGGPQWAPSRPHHLHHVRRLVWPTVWLLVAAVLCVTAAQMTNFPVGIALMDDRLIPEGYKFCFLSHRPCADDFWSNCAPPVGTPTGSKRRKHAF